jgi:hypothetical protein
MGCEWFEALTDWKAFEDSLAIVPAHPLIDLITSPEPSVRNRPLEAWAGPASLAELPPPD